MITDALKSKSATLRSELRNWLANVPPEITVKFIPREELMHLETEKEKPSSKKVVVGVVAAPEKALPNLCGANKQNAVKPRRHSAPERLLTTPSSRKEGEEVDIFLLLPVNNLKHQRIIDEPLVLKWNFAQPREEFVELLRNQMTAAHFNKELMANMFHSDFRFRIKAIESLMEDLPDHSEALISNLDLILKWLTLRFFDTEPSVLLKGLEYLHSVFNMLIEKKYQLLENEGSCFIPYLVQKIGDLNDSDRDNSVQKLALNCVVQAYNIVGEEVFKRMANISDEMLWLEERIRTSSRKSYIAEISSPIRNDVSSRHINIVQEDDNLPVPATPPIPVTTNDPDILTVNILIKCSNLTMAGQGLSQFMKLMNNPTKIQAFSMYEEDFFESIISLLKYLHILNTVNDPSVSRIYRDLFSSIDSFYKKPQLGKNVSIGAVKQLMNQLILLAEKCSEMYIDVKNICLNNIIEQSEHTTVLCALIQLMTEYKDNENKSERQVDLLMECIEKVISLMRTWGDDVDYESVLYDIHQFLVKFSLLWFAKGQREMSTIRKIIFLITEIKGEATMQLFTKIPDLPNSYLEPHISKLLKDKLELTNYLLTEVFKKIENEANRKKGVCMLYHFMKTYPKADIEPFLSKMNKCVQEYIKHQLQEYKNRNE